MGTNLAASGKTLTSVRLRLFVIKRGHSLRFTHCEDWMKLSLFSGSHGVPPGTGQSPGFERPWGHHSRHDAARLLRGPVSGLRVSLPVRCPPTGPAVPLQSSLTPATAGAEPRGHKGHMSIPVFTITSRSLYQMNHTHDQDIKSQDAVVPRLSL